MQRMSVWAVAAGGLVVAAALAGCEKKEPGPMEKLGRSVDKAADDAKKAADRAAEQAKKDAEEAKQRLDEQSE